jgi:hypothetical protein
MTEKEHLSAVPPTCGRNITMNAEQTVEPMDYTLSVIVSIYFKLIPLYAESKGGSRNDETSFLK